MNPPRPIADPDQSPRPDDATQMHCEDVTGKKDFSGHEDSEKNPRITLFAAPKAFEGHTGIIQRNAIRSWVLLRPDLEIFLFGSEPGIAEVADEFSVKHFPNVERNDSNTPLLDHIFRQAIDASSTDLMMYVNSDIIFDQSLIATIQRLQELALESFLGIGQRTDFDQKDPIDFESDQWNQQLQQRLKKTGQLASILCKDYFIFPGNNYRDIPAFSIGRGNWDNWMVARAAESKSPVVDLTSLLTAAHQNHGYAHAGGRMRAYVTGEEAKRNKELAGGTNYVSGSVATHKLDKKGQLTKSNRVPLLAFLKDFPRAARLVYQLLKRT